MMPPTTRQRISTKLPSATKMITRKTAASIFGDGLQKDAVTTPTPTVTPAISTSSGIPANLKRKATDPKLEIITVDPLYDLTVIVGTLEHSSGQKAFQINKGSFRNVGTPWSKVLSGEWKESSMSEICFPDDNCKAFLIVLQIAHFQFYQLPKKLSISDLVELAVLTGKYELYNAVRIGLEMKQWMQPYHKTGAAWPAGTSLPDFTIITSALQMQNDFQYLSNRLAMEVVVNEAGDYYLMDEKQNKTTLRSDLPPNVAEEIKRIRQAVLSAWTASCAVGFSDTINTPVPQCGLTVCAETKIGVLLKGLKAAGFYPGPSNMELLRGSLLSYWKSLADIGKEYKPYQPCKGSASAGGSRRSYSYQSHEFACSFDKCFGDFGIVNEARATLRRFAHKDLWEEYKIACILLPATSYRTYIFQSPKKNGRRVLDSDDHAFY